MLWFACAGKRGHGFIGFSEAESGANPMCDDGHKTDVAN
jgi:hypothetical protein